MKDNLKKFFLLGLGVAAAGAAVYAVKHKKKIQDEVKTLIKKKKLTKIDGEALVKELVVEIERIGKKAKKAVVKVEKKFTAKKAAAKKFKKPAVKKTRASR
jgi:hypothetical protein